MTARPLSFYATLTAPSGGNIEAEKEAQQGNEAEIEGMRGGKRHRHTGSEVS